MTETTATILVLTENQATFLNALSRVAADYRGSWESIIKRGEDELDRLNNANWVSGTSHQVMAEVQQEYGTLKTLLNLADTQWDFSQWTGQMRQDAIDEYREFIHVAIKENKGLHGSLLGGTWFVKGRTIADYRETEKK